VKEAAILAAHGLAAAAFERGLAVRGARAFGGLIFRYSIAKTGDPVIHTCPKLLWGRFEA